MNRKQDRTAWRKETNPLIQVALDEAFRMQQAGHSELARQIYNEVLKLNPDSVAALNNLGLYEMTEGRLDNACDLYSRALVINPDIAEIHNNMGLVLKDKGRLKEALSHYQRAIHLRPDYAEPHWNTGYVQLLTGDFAQGWKENEWRWKIGAMNDPGLTAPLWTGQDLKGKTILLYCEQGFGDSIQFIRYAEKVQALGAKVVLPCPRPLVRLFQTVRGIDEINQEGQPIPAHDYRAPLLSLPGIFKTIQENIPADIPYIYQDQQLVNVWRQRLAGIKGFKAGIVWRGNPAHTNDRNRSMNAAEFAEILNISALTVINMQKDARDEELKAFGANIYNAAPDLYDFADTADLISCLDIVISVDTSVCHLAGAIGRPVWTMIPFAPDWRWMLNRTDTPWYPTMKLFRQEKAGDWRPVIKNVHKELEKLCV